MATREDANTWLQIGFRAPPELVDGINQFAESIGETNNSNAVRLLLAAGLDAHMKKDIYEQKAVIDNAKADAMHLMDKVMGGALEMFREFESLDPDQLEDDFEDDEEDEG